MKKFKLYEEELKKFAKGVLFATSFVGTITLTGCKNDNKVEETTAIETTKPTRPLTISEYTIVYETKENPEETTAPKTSSSETTVVVPETTTAAPTEATVESLPETTAEKSLEGQVEPETSIEQTIENDNYQIPEVPTKFENGEELVSYVEEVTKICRTAVDNGKRTDIEIQFKKLAEFYAKKKMFDLSQPWGGIYYSNLTDTQKARYKACESIIKIDAEGHISELSEKYETAKSIAIEESLLETAKEKGSQALEKGQEIGGNLVEKIKTKVKKYWK